jgi:hypothetical protein
MVGESSDMVGDVVGGAIGGAIGNRKDMVWFSGRGVCKG